MRTLLSITALLVLTAATATAAIQSETVEYADGDVELAGHLAWDDSIEGRRPGVLVVHEWWGLDDYARTRAEQLAAMGYVAFALDMYGKGKLAEHPQDAMRMSGEVRANVDAWRKRAVAGLAILKDHALVDASRLAAIGYCFGGATVLQLAYSGADLAGVVSFHGALPAASPPEAEQVQAKILVCHGAADSFIPETQVEAFRQPLDAAGADYQLIYYAGAVHSFTNPGADSHGMPGIKYNKSADRRSWAHMKGFFDEIFAAGG